MLSEEAELKTSINGYNTKFNFKGNNVKGILDLKKNHYSCKKKCMKNLWIHPYIEASLSRNLQD